jgi:hypothetical protein
MYAVISHSYSDALLGHIIASVCCGGKDCNLVACQVSPCKHRQDPRLLSGPGWGNVNTQPTSWMARVLYTGKDCYLAEMNIHY